MAESGELDKTLSNVQPAGPLRGRLESPEWRRLQDQANPTSPPNGPMEGERVRTDSKRR